MNRLSIILVIICILCLSGCGLVVRPSTDRPKPEASVAIAVSDPDLLGLWSSEGASGELVDPATGFSAGSVYNGEWYLFRKDGTYRYVIVSSGQFLSGGVVCEGKYMADNGEIQLTDIKESWYPNPAVTGQKAAYKNNPIDASTVEYRYGDDTNTLIVDDTSYFTRVEG